MQTLSAGSHLLKYSQYTMHILSDFTFEMLTLIIGAETSMCDITRKNEQVTWWNLQVVRYLVRHHAVRRSYLETYITSWFIFIICHREAEAEICLSYFVVFIF